MRRLLLVALWSLIWLLAAAGVAVATTLAMLEGSGLVISLTLAFTIIASFVAALGTFITWRGNRAAAREQRQMADDLRRLAELTESSIEEARAQRPEPIVTFVLQDGETSRGALIERTRLSREVDVERIVATERERALATIPREKPKSRPTAGGTAIGGLVGALSQLEKLEALGSGALGFGRSGPATEEERAEFVQTVDDYEKDLRSWLAEYDEWRAERYAIIRPAVRFENRGRVPTYDARVELRFPDPFEERPEELPFLSDPPDRPRFTRRSPFDLGHLTGLTVPAYHDRLHRSDFGIPERRNVSRPRYRKGSVIVEIEIDKLLHGVDEDSDPIVLRLAEDGRYSVAWEIRAENLAEATRGLLDLEVVTKAETGPPITTLDEVVSSFRAVEVEEEPEE